jgi:hypothetical protein
VLDVIVDKKFSEIPHFLKHADHHPDAVLTAHSPETVHLTLALAIWLWEKLDNKLTSEMRAFLKLPDPFRAGYRASQTLKLLERLRADPRLQPQRPGTHISLSAHDEQTLRQELKSGLTAPSTGILPLNGGVSSMMSAKCH